MSTKKLGFGLMRLPLLDRNDDTGIDLEQAKKNSDGYSVLVDTLAAGESYENGFVFVSREAAPVSADTSEKSSIFPGVLAAVGALAVVAAIAFLAIRKRRAAALMLAVLMLVPCAGIFGVHAVGTEDIKSFTLEETVSIGGKDYPVVLTVSYLANSAKNSYFEFDVKKKRKKEVVKKKWHLATT